MKNRLDEFSKKSTLNRIDFSNKSRNQVMERISTLNRKSLFSIWSIRILGTAALLLLFLIPVYIAFQSTVEAPDQTAKIQKITPTKPPVEDLESQYNNLIKPDSTQSQVVNYNSKQELIETFTDIMSRDLAVQMADQFFRKTDEGWKLIATDGPATVHFDAAYDLTKINAKKYSLTQTQETQLTGKIRLSITYQYQNNKWIIQNRTIENLNRQSSNTR
ncbi:hypothetical protein [Virgibacillus ihumii]|uniref:hypothetical protein n=1 Tax=Virgibacillus ihumii TaxID=2686091 RepID=UPI00157BDD93|nr:hypothetical protein [Virgibacillus ihumii]